MAASEQPKKRGPRGGIKHKPGRGHDRKSGPAKTRRKMRKAARIRQEKLEEARRQWTVYDKLKEEVRKMCPELKPTMPRPEDD